MFHWFKTALTVSAVSFLSACGGSDDHPAENTTPPTQNIVQLAQAQNLNVLVAAATKAGLAPTLSSANSSLTVFAPTDAAFNALAVRLGLADGNALVAALPGSALANILTYHVLPSRKTAADLVAGGATQPTLYSFSGAATSLKLDTSSGVRITDAVLTKATVTTPNVQATNGIVHVVDKVLVPPGVLTVVQMAQANPAFSTLVGAVSAAGLVNTLSAAGPFTVFAPTNDAFSAIASTVAGLSAPQLTTVLTYHVLGSQVLSTAIPFGAAVATVSGQTITINNNPLRITDKTAVPAPITDTDIRASNGVIHVVSKVLIPTL
jgi:uncharacterized surface protein with fasciclin (FAS1) repeats